MSDRWGWEQDSEPAAEEEMVYEDPVDEINSSELYFDDEPINALTIDSAVGGLEDVYEEEMPYEEEEENDWAWGNGRGRGGRWGRTGDWEGGLGSSADNDGDWRDNRSAW